ncbi:LLM class flavin-dependent oxidoreductase [Mangrovimicrobium sediminis]|uniref:LLM class flavin-dependent oxidoreductase n=1 Tax=Mangrovimicrobium sediminis TaxID=2562682 RepID=A0A4Z0M938_9GAMM|nr:LLM class flavin-dependent oxidoreductase [Haliea sp. SAOS-164]TGD76232.1 LLM class flavin-dependent oxidoreductase [Haliea sp. SAOS-164]
MRKTKLRLGLFVAPFHPLDENPTLCLDRDLQLAEYADDLGIEEYWFGEHHSGGYEISASPELMIAAAAQRTTRIKLGTGVVSLPYHNPFNTAQRIAQLDHLTKGRLMFGAGPGLLTADAHMRGQDARESRDKLGQGLEVITRLLRGETVTEKSSWYDLQDAHCHLLPAQRDLEVCVASLFSPNGGTLAAKYNGGMLCLAATSPDGFDTLSANWQVACEAARKLGREMDPSVIRCATDMHIAETRDQAMDQVRKGFEVNQRYFLNQSGHLPDSPAHYTLEHLMERGEAVIGTPDDAIEQIRRLEEKVPGFGCLLLFDKNWSSMQHKKESLEMMMRYVLPAINGDNDSRVRSFDWQHEHREPFFGRMMEGAQRAIEKHAKEQAEDAAKK